MSETETINETLELVKEAQSQGTFNLSEVIKGRGYPQKDVTIYTDVESAFKLIELEKKLSEITTSDDVERFNALEAEANALAEKVQASRLIFSMRGVNQGVVESVDEEASKLYPDDEDGEKDPNWYKFYTSSLIAHNIVRVTDANGNVDERVFTFEDMEAVRATIPADSWSILLNTMQQLTLAGGFFKGLTDAGFLPKS